MNTKKNILYLYILTFPIALLFLSESWAYNPFGWLDHWSYFGSSYYYPRIQQIFPQHPMSELIPVYMINSILFNLFDIAGARLLRASVFLSLGLGFVFYISNSITGSKYRSYISSVAYGTYLYTLSAVGSDYTEIYIQLELLFSISCILGFYKENDIYKQSLWLVSFGFSISLLIMTAILSIVYIIILVIFYLSVICTRYKFFSNYRFSLNPLFGFLLGTCFFGLSLYNLNGTFLIINNIRKLFSFLGGAYQAPAFSLWINEASWLILPGAIIVSSFLYILLKINRTKPTNVIKIIFINSLEIKYLLFCIAVSSSLLFINIVVKQWALQFLYFGQTTPIYFIAMSILLFRLDKYSTRNKTLVCIFFTIFSALGYYYSGLSEHNFSQIIQFIHNNYVSPIAIIFLILLISIILSFKFDFFVYIFLSLYIVFNMYSFSPTFGCFTCADGASKYINRPIYMNSNRKILNLTLYLSRLLDVNDYSRKSMIWFSDDDNLGAITRQSFAMNYLNSGTSLINKEYPFLNNFSGPIGSTGTYPVVGNRILGIIYNQSDCRSGLKTLQERGFNIEKFNQIDYHYNDQLVIKFCEFLI